MKFKRTSYLTRLAALGVAAATLMVPLGTANAKDNSAENNNLAQVVNQKNKNKKNKTTKYLDPKIVSRIVNNPFNRTGTSNKPVTVIVTLKKQPKLPSKESESSNKADQNRLIGKWSSKYGMTVRRQFGYLMNGFEATLPANKVAALRHEHEVASVAKERLYYPLENYARGLQGVNEEFKKRGLDGTGMLVAIIDTGIDPSHHDMKLDFKAEKARKIQKTFPSNGVKFTNKVPAGFNYADENYTITDSGAEQHGMHVAGIVAANGDDENKPADKNGHINGIAPNAQLLAMKVFSNKPGAHGARDADIVAAIEDSVRLHADVINMSLGSDNGFGGTSNATSLALKKAREAGVLPVISAGNSGLSFSTSGGTNDALGKWDDATLGSPSSYPSAFSVASVENSYIIQTAGSYTDKANKTTEIPYSIASGKADGKEHEIVNIGLGKKDEVKDLDLHGKYALVERGAIAFSEKFQNAIDKGADGVIVYNKAGDSAQFLGMAGVEKFKCFGASIRREDALKIVEALKATQSGTVKVSFSDKTMSIANPDKLHPSSFTSWGPTPELDFKPHIAGIGGNVWSTQNNNKYTNMSGTSMAAPNVSGLSALVMESYMKRFPKLSPKDRATLVEQALMNTAEILNNSSNVPFAPRQIGAGLAQVDKAVATNVIATVNGNSYVALRQVNGDRKFTVKLHNYGDKAVTYEVPKQNVVNESNNAGEETTTSISSETLASSTNTVTVDPKSEKEVEFTLTPDVTRDHYVEGWARFTSKTSGEPDLAVPYLGFVGNWDKEPILVKPGEEYLQNAINMTTSLIAESYFGDVQVNDEAPGHLEFSPNGDELFDKIRPSLALFRNASLIQYSVLDNSGKTVAEVGEEHDVSRSNFSELLRDPRALNSSIDFDGTIYDKTSTDIAHWNKKLPDGKYIYRVKACLTKNMCQTTDMHFNLDTKAPTVTISEPDNDGKITITAHDELSETLSDPGVKVNGNSDYVKVNDNDCSETHDANGYTRTCKVNVGKDAYYVNVSLHDGGFNETNTSKVFKGFANKKILINNEVNLKNIGIKDVTAKKDNGVDKYSIEISGRIADGCKDVKAYVQSGTEAEKELAVKTDDSEFSFTAPIKQGANTIKVKAKGSDGKEVVETLATNFDEKSPTIKLTNADNNGNVTIDQTGAVEVKGEVKDETTPKQNLTLTLKYNKDEVIDGEIQAKQVEEPVTVGSDGSFTVKVIPSASTYSITLVASDGVNTTTQDVGFANRVMPTKTKAKLYNISLSNANGIGSYNWIVPGDSGTSLDSFTAKGKVSNKATEILFTKANRVKDDGSGYEDFDPIAATITKSTNANADSAFTVTLPMHPGINDFRMIVKEGSDVVLDTPVAFYFDRQAPEVMFSTPKLYGGRIFTNNDTVKFKGVISDDFAGYTLKINNLIASDNFSTDSKGKETNAQSFDRDVEVKNGEFVLIQAIDQMSSALYGRAPVVVDKDAPSVTLGIKDNDHVEANHKISVTAKDDHLKLLRVKIDGKEVNHASNGLKETDIKLSKNNPYDATFADLKDLKDPLKVDVDFNSLSAGKHLITVEAVDYAGNVATKNTSAEFVVEKKSNDGHGNDHGSSSVTVNPPSASTPAPKAPESTAKLDQSLKGSLVAGEHMNNVVRAGKNNPVKLYFAGMDAPAKGDAGSKSHKTKVSSATSEFIKELKKNKVAYAYAYMYSSPVLLKGVDGSKYVKVTLDKNGQPQFNVVIPAGYFGKHTIVLLNDKGEQLAWANVWVVPENATAFDETVAEINLKYSELHSGTGFGNGLGTGFGNGLGAGSGFGTFTGTTYVGTDGNAASGSGSAGAASGDAAANGNASAANGNAAAKQKAAEKEQAAAKSAAKKMTSDLAMTGSSVIGMVVTFMVLLASGAVTFKTRRRHVHASK